MSTQATICNKYCDGRGPSLASGDRTPVSATLLGRTITLHFDDENAMGWATIENGQPGDEVWLERSMDGGRTWTRLGSSGERTLMYNVDDWDNLGVGALRACGNVGDT